MRNTIAIFFLLASIAGAQTLESWTVDTDKAVPRPLVIRRGETRDLRVTFKNYSSVATIPTNADVQLWYRSADLSNGLYYVITGTVHSASAGVARVLWTAANCGAATNYTWDLVVLSNTTPYNLRAYGTIQLQAGVYSQATTATNPATYLALDWARIVNLNTNSAPFMTLEGVVTNGGCTVDGQIISNGAAIVTAGGGGGVSGATVTNIVGGIMATGSCATATTVTGAQSNRIEMALTNAAAFYSASNPDGYQTAAQVQGAAATVAGNVFTSFIGNPYSYRGSFTGHIWATSGNVLTNAAAFATSAQGSKADTALQPAATNGAEWGSHANLATNAGGAGAGYYAMSNGAWTAFSPGSGSVQTEQLYVAQAGTAQVANVALSGWPAQTTQVYVAQAGTAQVAVAAQSMPWSGLTGAAPKLAAVTNADTVTTITAVQIAAAGGITNGGASINGLPITNGASFTITGGSGGGLSNIVVAGVAGTLTGSGSNVVASVSLDALAGAGVMTNGSAHSSLSGVLGAGSIHVSASETNLIAGALQRSGGTMTGDLAMGTKILNGYRIGDTAGSSASGSGWMAIGPYSALFAVGNNWGAFGAYAGVSAIHSNSHTFGRYSGNAARGNNRMYLDVYAAAPNYAADVSTNDTIFMDSDGKLHLGGGAGRAENASAGGVLRGTWSIANATGITAAQVGAVSNGGASINGSPITNGASFTITGGGGGGGLSNIVVAGIAGTLSGSGSNVVASVSLSDLASAGVLTNETDTLATVLSNGNDAAGQSVSNLASISGSGRMALGANMSLDNIDSTAYGAHQSGSKLSGDTMTIGSGSIGSEQRVSMAGASAVIGSSCYGASQHGFLGTSGEMEIENTGHGAAQRGLVTVSRIYANGVGAQQYGYVYASSSATNLGNGALQLFDFNNQHHALTTADGDGSILLGAGTASNRYAIVAGDGQESHGDGSITAGGGFYGDGSGLTNITAAQVGALPIGGGTVTGSVLTTVDQLTTAPASDEFVTAAWARNALASGKPIYMTTNLFNAQWEPTNTTGVGSYDNGDQQWVSFAVTGVNHYVVSMIDTNPIPANTPLVGPATVHIHLGLLTGSPAGNYGFSGKPELYYVYDLAATSLTLGDFDADPQAWTAGSTNSRTFILSWPSVTPTNTYYRVFRLKCTAKGSATTNVVMGVGGTDSSFIQLQQTSADYTLTADKIAAAGGVTNGGATINGSPITNGASFTITGGAAGITNAVTTRIVTYDTTNPVITLAEGTNAWYWTPPTNVPLSCTFAGPGAGWAGSGMLRLIRDGNSTLWPTNAAWIVNGTRTTNAPTLDKRNAIIVDYFDGMWGLGLLTTNAAVVP